jgi:hypothetical protein
MATAMKWARHRAVLIQELACSSLESPLGQHDLAKA